MKTVGTSQSGAVFSDCGRYRYRLWRCWNPELPRACFILLNPSTADEIQNDPTIERQRRRVEIWTRRSATLFGEAYASAVAQFGSIEIVNAFAYRSTDPAALYEVADPIGEGNGDAIITAAQAAFESDGIVLCGWGAHIKVDPDAHNSLLDMLEYEQIKLHALKLNKDGTPQHPLYLPYSLMPKKWTGSDVLEDSEVVA